MDIEVTEWFVVISFNQSNSPTIHIYFYSWAVPCQKHEIHTYKPTSMAIDSRYSLNTYERNVQVCILTKLILLCCHSIDEIVLNEIGIRIAIYKGTHIFQYNSNSIT